MPYFSGTDQDLTRKSVIVELNFTATFMLKKQFNPWIEINNLSIYREASSERVWVITTKISYDFGDA